MKEELTLVLAINEFGMDLGIRFYGLENAFKVWD